MTWAKFDDQLHCHPKLAKLGHYQLPCIGLQLLAVCWSNATLSDGHIPRAQIFKLCGDIEMLLPSGKPWELVNPLVDAEIWEECAEHDSGGTTVDCYVIHDYLDYNPSRVSVLRDRVALSEARAEAGRLGGVKSAEARKKKYGTALPINAQNSEATPKQTPKQEQQQAPKQNSSPVPVPVVKSPNGDSGAQRGAPGRIFEAWKESTGKSKALLTRDRREKIAARLNEGYTEADLTDAVRGWKFDGWADRVLHNDLVKLLESGRNTEKFRDLYRAQSQPPAQVEMPPSADDAAYVLSLVGRHAG